MNFRDTSAIVPLLVRETDTVLREGRLKKSDGVITWWATRIECVSALCRREREGDLSRQAIRAAMTRLEAIAEQWLLVSPSDVVLLRAERLLRVHSLRAADAMQLAAALIASGEDPQGCSFPVANLRLAQAAEKEGFKLQ